MSLRWDLAQAAEWRWWKNYLKDKDKEEYLSWKRGYWQNLLEELVPSFKLKTGQNILDAGCGPAGVFIALKEHEVVAVDPLLDKYKTELSFFDPMDYPQTQFINSGIEDLKLSKQFDVVFCMNAINHVADWEKSFAVLNDHLKSGAYFILTIDTHNSTFLKKIFASLPGDVLHPHQHTLSEYISQLEKMNMIVLEEKLIKKGLIFNHYLVLSQKC